MVLSLLVSFLSTCLLAYFLLPILSTSSLLAYLSISYFLSPLYRVFFQHVYERVTVPSAVVSFPDEVEVEEAMSPTESDSRTPVSSSDLLSASSDFSFSGAVPLPL